MNRLEGDRLELRGKVLWIGFEFGGQGASRSLRWHIDRAGLPIRFSPTAERPPISVVDGDFDLVTGVVSLVYQWVHEMASNQLAEPPLFCLQGQGKK